MNQEKFDKLLAKVPDQFPKELSDKIAKLDVHKLHVMLENSRNMSDLHQNHVWHARLQLAASDELTRRLEEELFSRETGDNVFKFVPSDDGEKPSE